MGSQIKWIWFNHKTLLKVIAADEGGGHGRSNESLLAGAMAMALAHVNRQQAAAAAGSKVVQSIRWLQIAIYNIHYLCKVSARMLVLSASGDSAAQYMNYMNVFFTAQKLNIPVDVCMIGQDSGLLQQGSDITGGLYIKVHFQNPGVFSIHFSLSRWHSLGSYYSTWLGFSCLGWLWERCLVLHHPSKWITGAGAWTKHVLLDIGLIFQGCLFLPPATGWCWLCLLRLSFYILQVQSSMHHLPQVIFASIYSCVNLEFFAVSSRPLACHPWRKRRW